MTIDISYFEHWIIAPYAICLFASILIGLIYIALSLKHSGMKWEHISYILLLDFISILLLGNFTAAVMQKKPPSQAGFTSLGGMAGMLTGVWFSNYIFKEYRKEITKASVTALPLIYSISKLGCLAGGCCGGLRAAEPFAVRYVKGDQIIHDYAIPVQLIETMAFFCVFLIFVKLKQQISSCQMILICSAVKFFTDFLREVHTDTMISQNQIGCLVIMALTVIVYRWRQKEQHSLYR